MLEAAAAAAAGLVAAVAPGILRERQRISPVGGRESTETIG